jgi:hypothetical protein
LLLAILLNKECIKYDKLLLLKLGVLFDRVWRINRKVFLKS